MKKDFPMTKTQEGENSQAQSSGSNPDDHKINCFYALKSKRDQESSPDVITGMLKLFSFDVYALLDLGPTLSFVNHLVPIKF